MFGDDQAMFARAQTTQTMYIRDVNATLRRKSPIYYHHCLHLRSRTVVNNAALPRECNNQGRHDSTPGR